MGKHLRHRSFMFRPTLDVLEAREQPGSLLTSGIDVSPLAEWAPRPETPATTSVEVAAKRRVLSSDSMPLVAAPDAPNESHGELRVRAIDSAKSTSGTGIGNNQPALPAQAPNVAAKPGVNTATPPTTPPTAQRPTSATYDFSKMQITPAADTPVHGTVHPITTSFQKPNLTFERRECDGVGSKVPLWNTYEGTPGVDANLATASGKGAFLGFSYTVGYKGPLGTVQQYGPGGACLAAFVIADPAGLPVEVRDVATGAAGVYITGTVMPDTSAFVIHLTPALVPLVGIAYPAPPGGTVSLNGIGISPSAAMPNIFVTGHVFDPAIAPFDMTRVINLDPPLGVTFYDSAIGFGTPSRGRSIAADRAQHAYIAGIVAAAVPNHPLSFRLNAGGVVIPWAVISDAGAPAPDMDNGMNGVDLLGGVAPASGVYFTGSIADFIVNPLFDLQLLIKRVPATGVPIYLSVFAMPGLDLSGRANVVDRAGNHYTAGYMGFPVAHDAFFVHYDPTGTIPMFATPVGDLGGAFDDRGNGIDLFTRAPGMDVFGAGTTTTPTALMFPPPVPCDPTYNGMLDGFATRWLQPL